MINIIKTISMLLIIFSFVFSNTNEMPVYSGDAVISLSPVKKTKRIDIIKKTFATDSDEPLKKGLTKEDVKLEDQDKGAKSFLFNYRRLERLFL